MQEVNIDKQQLLLLLLMIIITIMIIIMIMIVIIMITINTFLETGMSNIWRREAKKPIARV